MLCCFELFVLKVIQYIRIALLLALTRDTTGSKSSENKTTGLIVVDTFLSNNFRALQISYWDHDALDSESTDSDLNIFAMPSPLNNITCVTQFSTDTYEWRSFLEP